jgi:hypothetical protein
VNAGLWINFRRQIAAKKSNQLGKNSAVAIYHLIDATAGKAGT